MMLYVPTDVSLLFEQIYISNYCKVAYPGAFLRIYSLAYTK